MKVVVSMTTIPARNGTLGPTLRSLDRQTLQPDDVRIYAADGAGDWDAQDLDFVTLHSSPDYGPITKLSAVLDPELDDDDLVVTVDDDIIYEPDWLETLVAAAAAHPRDAVGMSGWNAHRMLESTHGSFAFVRPPATCDVLEGWSGAAYRVGWFDASVMMPVCSRELRLVDDVWISSFLEKRGIARRVVCRPRAAEAYPGRAGLHTRPDFKQLNRAAARLAFQVI